MNFLSIVFEELEQFDLKQINDSTNLINSKILHLNKTNLDYVKKMQTQNQTHATMLYIEKNSNNVVIDIEFCVVPMQHIMKFIKFPILDRNESAFVLFEMNNIEQFYSLIINCYDNFIKSRLIDNFDNGFILIAQSKPDTNVLTVSYYNQKIPIDANCDISKFPLESNKLYIQL